MTIHEPQKKPDNTQLNIAAVVLAGGEGRRMGNYLKPLLTLNDKTLLEITAEKIAPQVHETYLNLSKELLIQIQSAASTSSNSFGGNVDDNNAANIVSHTQNPIQQLSKYVEKHTKNIILDGSFAMQGPLAGVLSAMKHAQNNPSIRYVLSVPADSPFTPKNITQKLLESIGDHYAVHAKSQEQDHYVVALWSVKLQDDIEDYLKKGHRSVGRFLKSVKSKAIHFSAEPFDPFFNINTPHDYENAKKMSDTLY